MTTLVLPRLKATWFVAPAAAWLIGVALLAAASSSAAESSAAAVAAVAGVVIGVIAIAYAACLLAAAMLTGLRGVQDHSAEQDQER